MELKLVSLVFTLFLVGIHGATVYYLTPGVGSINGETRITLHGVGFAKDHFEDGKGAEVTLVSDKSSISCRIHKDGCTETMIMCYTPKFPAADVEYTVKVKVDGVEVPDDNLCPSNSKSCIFTPKASVTPTITSVSPRSGPPGTVVTMCGRIITNRTQSNEEASTNGVTERITRVYFGGQKCQLRVDDTDELYGITLGEGTSRYGCMTCKLQGSFVGNINGSFLIEGPYGRSLADLSILHVSAQNKIAMFQTYAEVNSVSPAVGSTEGGTLLTITGQNFDETTAKAMVTVGGEGCVVESLSDTEITCVTPSQQATKSLYPGNRGVKIEFWNDTSISYADIDTIANLSPSDPNYGAFVVDQAESIDNNNNYVTRWSGFFVAPSTGQYSFMVKGDDSIKLYVSGTETPEDKELVSYVETYTLSFDNPTQALKVLNLTAGKAYYFEAYHRQGYGSGSFHLGAKIFHSTFNNKQTGDAVNEMQEVKVKSTIVNEVQNISLVNWVTRSAVDEVQTITIAGTSGGFQLRVDGISTGVLTFPASGTLVASALNSLPTISPREVTVSESNSGNAVSFTVTFVSGGDRRPIEVAIANGDLTGSVTEDTQGVASMESFQLEMDGVPSVPIARDADASTIEAGIYSIFGVKCPTGLTSPSDFSVNEDYEADGVVVPSGTVDRASAFCGRRSLKNPTTIFTAEEGKAVKASRHKYFCLAYKGALSDSVRVTYQFINDDLEIEEGSQNVAITFESDETTWKYKCTDLSNELPVATLAQLSIKKLTISSSDPNVDLYVDNVLLAAEAPISVLDVPALDTMRLALSESLSVSSVTVTRPDPSVDSFTVELVAAECSHNFPLLRPYYSQESGGIYRQSSWASGIGINPVRTSTASPPVTGSIAIAYKGHSIKGISAQSTASEFKDILEASGLVGAVDVTRAGTCAGYEWSVSFVTSTGDQEQMEIDESSTSLSGISPSANVTTLSDGCLLLDPIPGDMLRTPHTTPQISVYINNIPTLCDDGACDFEWSANAASTVTSVSPSSGTENEVLTIQGTGFDGTASNNEVRVGESSCVPQSATPTQLTCLLGPGASGTYSVQVSVSGKGKATGSHSFSYTASVTSVTPTSATKGGGAILTIAGTGLTSDETVLIDGNECTQLSFNFTQMTCEVPQGASAGSVSFVVENSGVATYTSTFTYNSPSGTVTAVNVTSASVDGSTVIEIQGTGFGSYDSSVSLLAVGGASAEVESWTSTSIVAILPSLASGSYPIRLRVAANDYADTTTNSIPDITYDFELHQLSPKEGSLFGGTVLTFTGTGFPEDISLYDIAVGDVGCTVLNVTSTSVVGQLEEYHPTHNVDNSGTHATYGTGYSWNPVSIDINEGDKIQWNWSPPQYVSGKNYRVCQTANASSLACDPNGFSSGAKSSTGASVHQFLTAGEYFYWSDYVDAGNTISFRGTVRVAKRKSQSSSVSMEVKGVAAKLAPVSKRHTRAVIDSCSPVTLPSGCENSGGSVTFFFTSCATPNITAFTVTQNSNDYTIEMTGEGFGTDLCQHTAYFMDQPLTITSASTTRVVATFTPHAELAIGVSYDLNSAISLFVFGAGSAAVQISNSTSYIFKPTVSAANINVGSCAGGAQLAVTGMHFSDGGSSVGINFPGVGVCEITEETHNTLTCFTPSLTDGVEYQVSISVTTPYETLEASGVNVTFTCGSAATPEVTAVSPTSTDGTDTLTISGTGFGVTKANVAAYVGTVPCTVATCSSSSITCNLPYTVPGTQDVVVVRNPEGNSTGSVSITVVPLLTGLSYSSGSTNGGILLRASGAGFVDGSTTVTVDGATITPTNVSSTFVEFVTPAHAAGSVDIIITSNGATYPAQSFSYSSGSTPVVDSLSPSSGSGGSSMTISGSNFEAICIMNTVTVCRQESEVTACSSSSLTVTLPSCPAGDYTVHAFVEGKGIATSSAQFTFPLTVSSMSPVAGSFGGGQVLTISGQGFDENDTSITLCGEPCPIVLTAPNSPTAVQCTVPAALDTGSGTKLCDVIVSSGESTLTHSTQYTYDASLTPSISSVSPARGGTGGGTTITISGSGFGSDVTVDIAGSDCAVQTVSDTAITCITSARSPSVRAKVAVSVGANGQTTEENADFHYIDVWSSPYTWGANLSLPVDGDMIVVGPGQTLMVDTVTAIVKMLLIQGGTVIFDEKDAELNCENILITEGGTFQIGTEAEPHLSKATITMHGNLRALELPIYGAKALAVRNGTLDLHGKPIANTWTKLTATAVAGTNTLTVDHDVTDWEVGSKIILATTGHRHSQGENEELTIAAISGDGKTITLVENTQYEHLGVTVTVGGTPYEMRAEVGLLTHNILFRGSNDPQFNVVIEACPDGFDTGEFATQTCFQGRHGEEMGSDQFGGHIMMHAPEPNKDWVVGRIEHVELNYVGQAFRLGRYPIHFHLNGDMTGSYVKGCAIHETFNRAVNIHGTHNVLVERTVGYNIMGGAFFLEDGIETGNIIQYNLAVFVKSSTSLLNDDITPAAFWVTNPNNTIRHNTAVGGTHFGFWYRMHEHPGGPSFDANICPQKVPLLEFKNNTCHSQGWFGIWIFQEYFPTETGACDDTVSKAAVFDGLYAWNNEKGAEWVRCGAMQFKNFIMFNNEKAGIEMKLIDGSNVPRFDEGGAMIENSHIVGYLTETADCTVAGIILPFDEGLILRGNTFSNFDQSRCHALAVTRMDGTCVEYCGGWQYDFYNTTWVNSPNKCSYDWEHEGILKDMDGTLTGVAGQNILPTSGLLPTGCTHAADYSKGIAASMCAPSVKLHRFAFNQPSPQSLEGKDAIFENQYGSSSVPFAKKRLTHKLGWMVVLVSGTNTTMHFENVDHVTNISYTGTFYTLEENDCLIINHNFTQKPDRFGIIPSQNANSTDTMVTCAGNYNYDYYFNQNTKDLYYLISGRDKPANSTRKKRTIVGPSTTTRDVDLQVYRCWYKDCIPPPDPSTVPPPDTRPGNFTMWTDLATWEGAEEGYGGNCDNVTCLPKEGDNVKIREGQWVVINEPLPKFTKVYIYGVLEFNNTNPDLNVELSGTHIFVSGGRLIAGFSTAGDHMQGQVTIKLSGNHQTDDMPLPAGPNMGAKALGIFGGLDLHGKPRSLVWTRLAVTANQGDSQIQIADAHDWQVGEDIVIAPTGFEASECETARITAVSGQTITLNMTLAHTHLVNEITSPELVARNKTFTMAAEVGLLSRNIKVVGEDYRTIKQDAFGARVIMGTYSMLDQIYRGWARISNVEFYRGGQLGWTDSYDPRYALVWLDTGDVIPARPSYVRDCAFHNGLGPAIGVFGSNKIPIENNVIHHTVGSGIIVEGSGNEIRHNLVTHVVWNGHYDGRYELWNLMYDAGIKVNNVVDVVMEDNVVAGSERLGYSIKGEICDDTVGWKNNEAHSVYMGTMQLPGDEQPGCSKLSGFRIWRAFDFGIYSQTESSILMNDLTLADNGVGMWNLVVGPASLTHICEDKTVTVQNSTIIGDSGTFSCSDDVDRTTNNFKISSNPAVSSRSYRVDNGMVGIAWFGRSSGVNAAPIKKFLGEITYPALCGKMTVKDTLFYGFNADRCSRRNYVFSTNPKFEDNFHPIYLERNQVAEVDDESRAFFHRASVGKVNPADCIDMVCDAKQNCFIADTDGSFLGGSPGTLVAQAEYEWDGDASRGVGDHRIPEVALTTAQGAKLNAGDVFPNKGIVGTNTCAYMSTWQAYKCQNSVKYTQLVIENMDHDTEERRLSPVALLSPNEKYVNLLNGPQDHGWCNGYTCQKRLSTFWAMVAMEREYRIYFSGTSPEHLRLRLLNVGTTDSLKLAVYYRLPQRFDVFYQDARVPPLNEGVNANGDTALLPTPEGVDPTPSYSDGPGANYFDRDYKLLYFIMNGTTPIDIKMSAVLVLSFDMPAMSVDDFFGTEIVNNLAIFLGVPKSKIKFVSAVNAKTGSRRRRATDDTMTVTFEVGDGPTTGVNDTVSDPTSKSELDELAEKITDAAQQETLGDALGTNVSNTAVAKAAPSSDSSEWGAFANQTLDDSSGTTVIDVPSTLFISQDAKITSEGVIFKQQPWLQFRDSNGNILSTVGTDSTSWVVSASIREGTGHADAVLTGTTTATFVDGIAKFTDLAITHHDKGYILDFNLTSPNLAVLKLVASKPKTVPKRGLKLAFHLPHLPPTDLKEGKLFALKVKISDPKSSSQLDIAWRGHNWTATVKLHTPGQYQGELVGNTTGIVDVANNEIDFSGLSFTKMSKYNLDVVMESSPTGYSYKVVSGTIDVKPPGFKTPSKESKKGCRMRFVEDYSIVRGNEAAFEMSMYNQLATKYTTVSFDSFASSEGSVIVTFNVEGSSSDTTDTIAAIYAALDAGYTVTFNGYTLNADGTFEIDGVSYGVTTDTSGGLSTTEIIIIAVVCSVVIIAILTTVLVVYYVKSKNKKGNDFDRKATSVENLNDKFSSIEREQVYLQWRLGTSPEKLAATKSTIAVQDAYGRGAALDKPMVAVPTDEKATPLSYMMGWDNPAIEDGDYGRPLSSSRSTNSRPGTTSSLRRALNGFTAKVQPSDDGSSEVDSRPGSARTLTTPHMSAERTRILSAGELRATGKVPAVE